MRWQDYRRSDNVEEGSSSGPSMFGGGLRLSGGAIILVVVVSLLLGKNPLEMLALLMGDGGGPVVQTQAPQTAPRAPVANDPQTEFVARVLGDTEDVWGGIFQKMGTRYQPPKLTLYHGQIASACGFSSAAAGPFYCPGDRKVYLDLSFFQELSQRFGAPGDFARAYVIAHEIGHHVQNQLGLMDAAQQRTASSSDRSRNDTSVRLELQADCLAGVWDIRRCSATSSTPRMSSRELPRRRRSAMTASRSRPAGTSCPKVSPTVRRPSGLSGSGPDSTPATCGSATPLPPAASRLGWRRRDNGRPPMDGGYGSFGLAPSRAFAYSQKCRRVTL